MCNELRLARAWMAALISGCDAQPEMVNFSGLCLVHRAEIMQLAGSVAGGARRGRAGPRTAGGALPAGGRGGPLPAGRAAAAAGAGWTLAEDASGEANRFGLVHPQPGLALLRLTQGRADTAAAAIRARPGGERPTRSSGLRLLPAAVEILLAAADVGGRAGRLPTS